MLFQKTSLIHFWKKITPWSIQLFFPLRINFLFFFFPKVILSFPSWIFRESHQNKQLQSLCYTSNAFPTVLQGHCPLGFLLQVRTAGSPMPLGASRHYWFIHNDLFVPRSCQSSSARAQDTGKQEWEVWPRGTRSLLLTLGPHVLSDVPHFIRLAIKGNPAWKTISWFGCSWESKGITSAPVSVSSQYFSLPWHTHLHGFLYLFIHSLTQTFIDHLLTEMCRVKGYLGR